MPGMYVELTEPPPPKASRMVLGLTTVGALAVVGLIGLSSFGTSNTAPSPTIKALETCTDNGDGSVCSAAAPFKCLKGAAKDGCAPTFDFWAEHTNDCDLQCTMDHNSLTPTEPSFCWRGSKTSHGRGVGTIPTKCGGTHPNKSGWLCYRDCPADYVGNGPVCWKTCPSDFRTDPFHCGKPAAYGRGAGYALWHWDRCNKQNTQGCESWGLMYYPKCKAGYRPIGCCICSPICPEGYTDIGVSCVRPSHNRGVGIPMSCGDLEQDAGLCYGKCEAGMNGIGPVCWAQCPHEWITCGSGCAKSNTDCMSALRRMGKIESAKLIAQDKHEEAKKFEHAVELLVDKAEVLAALSLSAFQSVFGDMQLSDLEDSFKVKQCS
eukprot:NODE_2243_length_1238_cov_281.019802_g2132_i0.p1 GENE.NODE_2243_length_1238_cov_281.019802_g2132_i0~~NODE_2243_length_1238_cov_281.019802_g2132_i0.p1  ORF type:complete len:395 (+),score=63.49 NODE_2243_length_1238_cov_281.019802_g2132_i0:56-1186(+)